MDSHEATRAVFSRIQNINPGNAHKIVGYILLQDNPDKEMIRLAFGPDNLIHSVISKAKTEFAVNSPSFYTPKPSSPNTVVDWSQQDLPIPINHVDSRIRSKLTHYMPHTLPPQRSAVAALMMEEEMHKLNRFQIERNDGVNSKQIYLTFPSDSTFKEEDVSDYFSIFGLVQDVRIPYQQKRMFGFVTFLYPETVRIILAKGNPHFVCDSRVLVKPYKEKGKSDKNHQFDISGLDRELFEMTVGPRMYNSNQEMLRKKLQLELRWEQALEFQRRRLTNLQLFDLQNHRRYQYDASVGSPNVFLDEPLEDNQSGPNASPTEKPLQEDANTNMKDYSDIKLLDAVNVSPPKPRFLEIPRLSSDDGAFSM